MNVRLRNFAIALQPSSFSFRTWNFDLRTAIVNLQALTVSLSTLLTISPANGDQTNASESQEFSAQSFLSMIDEIRDQVPDEEWKKLPTDLSKNINHYLYGAPKGEE
ncbi:MAG: hypothetical protein ACFE0J_23270 [Elainellaceae cyanobacterium]